MGEAVEFIQQRTVVLVATSPHDGQLHVAGTGILFEIGGDALLMSAFHVVHLQKQKVELYVSAFNGTKPARLFPASSAVGYYPYDQDNASDDVDVAVVRLEKPVVEYLKQNGKKFLNRSDIADVDTYHDNAHLMIYGFPDALLESGDTIETKSVSSITHTGLRYKPEPGSKLHFDPKIHIGIEYTEAAEDNQDDAGNLIVPPKPHGVSGCGMWMLHNSPKKRDNWSTGDIKLVGIQHKWSRASVLVGSKVLMILRGMYAAFPDMRAALSLVYFLPK